MGTGAKALGRLDTRMRMSLFLRREILGGQNRIRPKFIAVV